MPPPDRTDQLIEVLRHDDASVRLQAALLAGTHPEPDFVPVLVARCAIEPDFFVCDMLTWALVRLPADLTVPVLMDEVRTGTTQARAQGLHSLSKIGDPRGWDVITRSVLVDADENVARTAWRAAVILVPEGEKVALAEVLVTQLGRGDRMMRRALSRALSALGDAAAPALRTASNDGSEQAKAHAVATQRMIDDPEGEFALDEAGRLIALAPSAADSAEDDKQTGKTEKDIDPSRYEDE